MKSDQHQGVDTATVKENFLTETMKTRLNDEHTGAPSCKFQQYIVIFRQDINMEERKQAVACLQTCYMPECHADTAEQPQDSQDLQRLDQLEETAANCLSGKSHCHGAQCGRQGSAEESNCILYICTFAIGKLPEQKLKLQIHCGRVTMHPELYPCTMFHHDKLHK